MELQFIETTTALLILQSRSNQFLISGPRSFSYVICEQHFALLLVTGEYAAWGLSWTSFLRRPELPMPLVIEFWIGRIPMLSQYLFVKSGRHCGLGVTWIIILASRIADWIDWLGMRLLILLTSHFVASSLFGSVLGSAVFQVFVALDSAVLVEHVLRWRLIHDEPISSFLILRCLSFGVFFWIWIILFYILHRSSLFILNKTTIIFIITLFCKGLIHGHIIITLCIRFII